MLNGYRTTKALAIDKEVEQELETVNAAKVKEMVKNLKISEKEAKERFRPIKENPDDK